MGNELADAIRSELRSALLARYGTLEAAAEALDMPYNTLRRHLTSGKDRTARVPLDFVLDTAAHLGRVSGVDFNEIYRRAKISADVPGPQDTQESYDLVANDSINEFPPGDDADFDQA